MVKDFMKCWILYNIYIIAIVDIILMWLFIHYDNILYYYIKKYIIK